MSDETRLLPDGTDHSAPNVTVLTKCADPLPAGRVCGTLRFTQILALQANPATPTVPTASDSAEGDHSTSRGKLPPGAFVTLNPRHFGVARPSSEEMQRRLAPIQRRIERAMPVTRQLLDGELPDPEKEGGAVSEMRNSLAGPLGERDPCRASNEQIVLAYKSTLRRALRAESLAATRGLRAAGIQVPHFTDTAERSIAALARAYEEMLYPAAAYPLSARVPHIVFCAIFQQTWCHLGYTRGEKIATIALAPGEEATLEIHSWTKDTFKSEHDLAVESEMRLTNKLTARDYLEVANELVVKGHAGAKADLGLTIPIEGIPVNVNGGTDVSGDLANTLETTMQRTAERTVEAANSLKATRKQRIEESRELGRDEKQLRKVVNTNRCHTLNIGYFEVLAEHEVSVDLLELRPCLLLPVRLPDLSPKWVLCHEHILKGVLLDKVFLSGFEAARVLETKSALDALGGEEAYASTSAGISEVASGQLPAGLESELGRLRDDILRAYATLKNTVGRAEDDIEDLASINLLQPPWDVAADLNSAWSALSRNIPSLIYWGLLQLNHSAKNGLRQLDASSDRPAMESLRAFFASVSPRDFQYNLVASAVAKALDAVGIPADITDLLIDGGLLHYASDDHGLHVAVKAASTRMSQVEIPFGPPPPLADVTGPAGMSSSPIAASPSITRVQVAQAQVEFDRLKCHIVSNRDHYFHATWTLEPESRGSVSPPALAAIVSPVPIGFIGARGAFPLIDTTLLAKVIQPKSVKTAIALARKQIPKPVRVQLPCPGPIAELTLGQCPGCEDYIVHSRDIDLRQQLADARKVEAEADRREALIAASRLDSFDPCCAKGGGVIAGTNDVAEIGNTSLASDDV